MRAFIDFEASSSGPHGYPIEVAWVFEDGRSESFLIAPVGKWTDWDPAAEAAHGITRDQLMAEGLPTSVVATRLVEALQGREVFAGAPSRDGVWLGALLWSGGFPRDAVRLEDTEAALMELAAALLAPFLSSSEIHRAVRKILAEGARHFVGGKRVQRALPGALFERERWQMISRLAHTCGEQRQAPRHLA